MPRAAPPSRGHAQIEPIGRWPWDMVGVIDDQDGRWK